MSRRPWHKYSPPCIRFWKRLSAVSKLNKLAVYLNNHAWCSFIFKPCLDPHLCSIQPQSPREIIRDPAWPFWKQPAISVIHNKIHRVPRPLYNSSWLIFSGTNWWLIRWMDRRDPCIKTMCGVTKLKFAFILYAYIASMNPTLAWGSFPTGD